MTAGLEIKLLYNDPTHNTIIRKLGVYHYNMTAKLIYGNESSVCFNAKGLKELLVNGAILGKIPVKIRITASCNYRQSAAQSTTIVKTLTVKS